VTAADRAILEAREAGLEAELARVREHLGRAKPRRARRPTQPRATPGDVTSLDEARLAKALPASMVRR